ncbi:MAG TPA: MBL fold metallo-hydrolase [Clostridiaceae bacterium]|nr:MBL fold metallo-hydrolase [Clostridiaceae bacterium]
MKITFLGAAKTVTGSCFLVETEKCKLLVDCGMFQGRAKEVEMNKEDFDFNPTDIDFVLLTHAHIDHSGRIPKLYLDGFKGEVITTKATADLCAVMLPDSGHIQEFENEWENRKRKRAGKPPVKPLYTLQDAVDCMKLFRGVKYGEIVDLTYSIKVRFNDAGHILGSSIIELWVYENGENIKTVFTGDLGNRDMPIVRDPAIIEDADYLVMESTYGNRLHRERENKAEKFLNIILDTVNKGGNVVIPSFAIGRTQEIIYELNKHMDVYAEKYEHFKNIPVFIDSPLAISATEIFRKNLDCFDEEARKFIESGDNPLDFPGLRFTKTSDESKALNERMDSSIIISASGMCEAGRIKHHLKHNLWRSDSTILFVGYQAEGTLGRRILDGAKSVKIFGEEISINARIEMIEGFSGHADKDGLMQWVGSFVKKPRKVFVVHGEENVMREFASELEHKFNLQTIIPSKGDSFIITLSSVTDVTGKPQKIESVFRFKRLEILDYLEKIKEEIDEMSEIIKEDLKRETDDSEVEAIKQKLKNLEKSILDVIA